MAYQNLTLRNIAGEITAQFNDGSFRSLTPPDPSNGETAAFIGTASSGVTHEFFQHVDLGRTFTEFGADSEIAKMVQSAKASDETLPVIVNRIGARSSSLSLKRNIASSKEKETVLRIVPKFVQEQDDARGRKETLDALKFVLLPYVEGGLIRQRLILGLESASQVTVPVYDSERLIVADGEAIFDVEMNLPLGEVFYTSLGVDNDAADAATLNLDNADDWAALDQATRIAKLELLNSVVSPDWANAKYLGDTDLLDTIYLLDIYGAASQNTLTVETGFTLDAVVGSANKMLSNKSQRYVGVDLAYQGLQFEDVGYIYCEGCHADTECVDIDSIVSADEQLLWPHKMLGNLWKFEYDGQEYSYMFGRNEPFKAANIGLAADKYTVSMSDPGIESTVTIDEIVFTQNEVGVAGDGGSIRINRTAGANNPAVGGGGQNDQALVQLSGALEALVISVLPHIDGAEAANNVIVTKAMLVDILSGNAGRHPGVHVELLNGILIENLPFSASTAATDELTLADATDNFAGGRDSGTFNIEYEFSAGHKDLGDLLNLVDIHFDGTVGTVGVECAPNDKGRIDCFVSYDNADIMDHPIETPFVKITMKAEHPTFQPFTWSHRLRPSTVTDKSSDGGAASDATSIFLRTAEGIAGAASSSVHDPFVMTHHDLTGQFVPEGVLAKLIDFPEELDATEAGNPNFATLKATNAQVREVSFLQQAAQAAYTASTNYSQCIAVVPTSAPENADRGLQRWAGQPATYAVNSQGDLKVTQNGTGILGMKLLAGRTDYRGGAAFGGIMLTEGNDLPNEKPYGISYDDEARDAYGERIDLGKHVLVVGAYGIVPDPESVLNRRRANRTGAVYTNAGPKICGILNSLAPGNEPIGQVNGRVTGMTPRHSTTMAVLNNLALIRVCMIDQNGIISSIYTAAQPNSDYRKISSIMSSNAILKQLRAICMPYVGRPFKDEEIASLTQTIDGAMKQMVSQDYAQSINVSLSASRLDRINGVLRASVRFVPPLSIEAITVEITLEPPAAGL